jgi:hypothetical protein
MSQFIRNLLDACETELNRFEGGAKSETDDPQYKYVKEYWVGIGNNKLTGKTQIKDSKGKLFRPAWSAAFISFVVRAAGAGDKFRYGEAHCHYIVQGMKDRESGKEQAAYWTFAAEERAPQLGDLICAGREYASEYDYRIAKFQYAADGFFPSHCDVVVSVDPGKGLLRVIGGNVSNSVSMSTYAIDQHGFLLGRTSTRSLPWIGVMACRL